MSWLDDSNPWSGFEFDCDVVDMETDEAWAWLCDWKPLLLMSDDEYYWAVMEGN